MLIILILLVLTVFYVFIVLPCELFIFCIDVRLMLNITVLPVCYYPGQLLI